MGYAGTEDSMSDTSVIITEVLIRGEGKVSSRKTSSMVGDASASMYRFIATGGDKKTQKEKDNDEHVRQLNTHAFEITTS